jgi:hypothetical protein
MRLEGLLDACLLALANERQYDFGDNPAGRPFQREMFEAHFGDLVEEMDRWNEAIQLREVAVGTFRAHILNESAVRGFDDPP